MNTITAIIQARMNSTRLPQKVMADINGKPLLWYIFDRLRRSQKTDKLVLATTENAHDNLIAQWCNREGIECFRGAEDDVLDRFYQAAKQYSARDIVRITADCPLIDPAIVDEVIALRERTYADYASNVHPATFPDGLDVEVMTFDALEKAWDHARYTYQREHVTSYITENPDIFKIVNLSTEPDYSHWRLTVDEPEDLEVVKLIYSKLDKPRVIFGYQAIVGFILTHPETLKINNQFMRNETYNREDK